MWPFSHPRCPVCKGELVPHSGAIGHAAYRCPGCIQTAKLEETVRELDEAIAYNRATIAHYSKEPETND